MVNVLIFNDDSNWMERYALELDSAMPYVEGDTLTVREFRGKSNANLIWTTKNAMEAWNATRSAWGNSIYVGYAFRRIGEGGHANQSQHYAGTSFDVAQNLTNAQRSQLRNLASSLGVWGYVEPAYLTPTWVHFDARQGTPACAAGFPMLMEGHRGVYVAVLQDALSTIGIPAVGIDGIFGQGTRAGVVQFQVENGLPGDGIVGCQTWTTLTAMANGFYRRNTSIPTIYQNE